MQLGRAEVLIVGAGIIGLTLARELVTAGYDNIFIIEKEPELGLHASGRNSGVLHAGIYYSPDSLKGRSCLNGNFLMRAYCKEKGLPLLESGKVIVARTEGELATLDELYRRATANGAKVEFVDEKQLAEIEPNARTAGRALFSHYTAVVDPKAILQSLKKDLESSGRVRLLTSCKLIELKGTSTAVTSRGEITFARFINAAGAYCDQVARLFEVGTNYWLIPFKGLYRKLKQGTPFTVNSNIYPVPDIRNPFLGIHFTRSVKGDVYLGPTAIPAFGRENYGILAGIDAEAFCIALEDAILFAMNPQFRSVALSEPKKYIPGFFYRDAARLVKELSPRDIESSGKVGIRAQLVNGTTKELVMDFVVETDGDSLHILNPISPAFTSSMDLAQNIVTHHF
ncbi:MAG: FAD dependent [Geobacteraceae bacterium]|nr:MAG: FAD dependent [Geobacteraceae bacterium]